MSFSRRLIFLHNNVLYIHCKVDPQMHYIFATIVNDTLFGCCWNRTLWIFVLICMILC